MVAVKSSPFRPPDSISNEVSFIHCHSAFSTSLSRDGLKLLKASLCDELLNQHCVGFQTAFRLLLDHRLILSIDKALSTSELPMVMGHELGGPVGGRGLLESTWTGWQSNEWV